MKIAYLFLTYDNVQHKHEIKSMLKTDNIYIHPKYPENVDDDWKQHIISKNVSTSWGDISIVRATITLLREAIQNRRNTWFVLLAQDCFPIASHHDIHSMLEKQTKSMFDLVATEGKWYKTSQWWILHRRDVECVLRNHGKFDCEYRSFSEKHRPKLGFEYACDELYFLSLLKWCNPEYAYINCKPVYTQWLHNVHMHHPVIYNKLTAFDLANMHDHQSLFIRKTSKWFNGSVEATTPGKLLMYVYVNYERNSSAYTALINNPGIDVVCLTHNLDLIPEALMRKSLHVYVFPYKEVYGAFLDLYHNQLEYMKQWQSTWFVYPDFIITENGDYTVHDTCHIPLEIHESKSGFREGCQLPNVAAFHCIEDTHGHVAYFI